MSIHELFDAKRAQDVGIEIFGHTVAEDANPTPIVLALAATVYELYGDKPARIRLQPADIYIPITAAEEKEERRVRRLREVLENASFDGLIAVVHGVPPKQVKWGIYYRRGHRTRDGIIGEPEFQLGLESAAFFTRGEFNHSGAFAAIRDTMVRIDLLRTCRWALVDCDSYESTQGGTCWSYHPIRPLPWERDVQHFDWWLRPPEERRGKLRGVYWGNYYGPELAKLVDPDGTLIERYLAQRWAPEYPSRQHGERLPSGAIFLTVSDSPFDVAFARDLPDDPRRPEIMNAVWLRHEFRRLGVL